jgi:hypothetical protein
MKIQWLISLGGFISQKDFVISFWSSVLSTALVTVLIWLYLKIFTRLFRYPKLTLVIKQDGIYSQKIKITKTSNGDYEASFRLAIKNDGKETFESNKGYWHLFFLNAEKMETLKGADVFLVQGETNHLRDIISFPIYPKSFLDFGPEIKFQIKKQSQETVFAHYFFATDFGYFPKSISLNQESGQVEFSKMGLLELEWPTE